MRHLLEVTIEDADGDEHEYLITHLPGGRALELSNRLATMMSGSAGLMLTDADSVDVGATAGNAILNLCREIKRQGDAKFWQSLLDQVIRDGVKMYGGKSKNGKHYSSSRATTEFDTAYAGNLGEYFQAVYHVLYHNFGKSIEQGLGKLGSVLEGKGSGKVLDRLTALMDAIGGKEEAEKEEAEEMLH